MSFNSWAFRMVASWCALIKHGCRRGLMKSSSVLEIKDNNVLDLNEADLTDIRLPKDIYSHNIRYFYRLLELYAFLLT